MVDVQQIKQLRKETGVGPIECKKALVEANGDTEKAKYILRTWGKDFASKKTARETKQGIIEEYIHPNSKIGVLIDIRCESDFVAKSEDFKKLSHEVCLQIAAMKPLFLTEEEIPEEFLSGEQKIYQEQFKDSGRPQKIVDEIIEGKLKKYKEEISLLSQYWIKDNTKTMKELIAEYITRTGENIEVKRFTRYEI